MSKQVNYYRVSTVKQGKSGLGLEAQKAACLDYSTRTGSEVLKEFVEVESGKKSDRPQLAKALAFAKRNGAVLCVAKLDRLSRNVAFLSVLMESGVDFVACDNPAAGRLILHILIAVAENEARAISDRTKAALMAYVARGGKLGNPRNLTEEEAAKGRKLGRESLTRQANAAYADLYPTLAEKRAAGLSLRAIADALNADGEKTRRGKPWNPVQVMLVLKRGARLTAGK